MKKIDTQVKSFTRAIKKLYPGISDDTAAEAVKALYILVIDFKLTEDDDAWTLYEAKISDLADADADGWAAEMVKSRVNRARPFYDKAIATDSDPVEVIKAMCGLSEQAACDLVNAFKDEDSQKPSIPAPASDPFNTDEESKDEEKEEQYA
jgi:hypothetical protein